MNAVESLDLLQERIAVSELGLNSVNDPLMDLDIWSVLEIGYTEEESNIMGVRNIYFEGFSLPWLKLLAKLTAKASIREKCSLDTLGMRIRILKQFDDFLTSQGYNRAEILTDSLLQEFVSQRGGHKRQSTIIYVVKLWAEERWIKLSYTPPRYKKTTPRIETIPEEVLCQIYNNFDVLPSPLERLFRLQLVLGCRINEVIRMPRQCLKQEGDEWFILRWIAKRKHWKFHQIHPLVAELVRAQQKFLDTQQCINDNFDKLFCMTYAAHSGGSTTVVTTRFDRKPVYLSKIFNRTTLNSWLQDFSKKANLKDKHSNQFNLTSHQFRRTKASIMAYCETDDEYIAAVLGHASLDMLPHYRKQDLNRLEREAEAKGYVDMYGEVSTFKPKKQRYEKLAEIFTVTTSLGECHRPIMLGDCEYRYACLSCTHHRVTLEDKPHIEVDIDRLQQDLKRAQIAGQERRITEIHRLLSLLSTRLQGLEKLQNIKTDTTNEQS